MLAPLPDEMSFRQAAVMEPMAVSLHGIRLAGIGSDDGVAVTGAGPIGLFAAAWLREMGVRGLIVSEPSEVRRNVASIWADHAVNPLEEDLADMVRETLEPGADVLIECSGNARVLEDAFTTMMFAGRILLLGACLENVNFNPASMLVRETAFYGSYGCDMGELKDCIEAVASGRIDVNPIISRAVSQEELPDAFERLCGPNDDVKLVMEIL
jgi:threonine dehydrogenase-like Zn-dependent dehydrogenase